MAIKFRNNTTSTLLHLGSRVTTPSLCYRQNGTTYYAPLLTSRSQAIGSYVYDASYPTFCCRYNNTTYYAAKSRSSNYDIPAGTYTPSQFGNLLAQFINSTRTCMNSFTITAYYPSGPASSSSTIPANSVIKFVSYYSNRRKGYTFNGGNINTVRWESGKAGYITYDTYNSPPFQDWNRSLVYVSGIKFN